MEADKLDISIKDITFEKDFKKELIKKLKILNYAQAFMWLGIKFVNEDVTSVTSQQLSNEVWGWKDESYCLKVLKKFEMLKIIKSKKKPGKKPRYFELATSKKVFKELGPVAMQKIKEAKE